MILLVIFEAFAIMTTVGGWLVEGRLKKFSIDTSKCEVELV